ncbi:hypothetical protein GUJ93_ZPchr0001g30890 [Zizania palustris]|uniref:Uncharacterized protein n=1 Tax=Zizania palustris TaxID=103762 RepID=A0A8J5VLH7_ZIZPA|nr:hypothetical protein GUJ93_ZPchr0001g30890 [Zizania palustris]
MSGGGEGVRVLVGDGVPAGFVGDGVVAEVEVAPVVTEVRSSRTEGDSGDGSYLTPEQVLQLQSQLHHIRRLAAAGMAMAPQPMKRPSAAGLNFSELRRGGIAGVAYAASSTPLVA